MGYNNDNDHILTPEQAQNLINHDHLDEDENGYNYSTDFTSKDQPGYGLMAVAYEYDGVNTDDTKPMDIGID